MNHSAPAGQFARIARMVESDWLDAPGLAAWVRRQPEHAKVESRLVQDRLRKWGQGGVVSVYVADRWLVRMGICLLDVPEWLAVERPRGR